MKRLKSKSGFTLAEMLMVVAIVLILSGVSFIAVTTYQRSLGQLERDGIAKEIFVAAQNHLTAAYGAGYFGVTSFGTEQDSDKGIYSVDNTSLGPDTIMGQMLPFGAIDETVRIGGRYVILYQKDTGQVLDVFYCTSAGTPSGFNYNLTIGDYGTIKDLGGDANKESRSRFPNGGNAILGWYGVEAASAILIPQKSFKDPIIEVVNAEKLYVKVTDPNLSNLSTLNIAEADLKLKLIVTGVDSKAQKAFELQQIPVDSNHVKVHGVEYAVILDDVTLSGMHFAQLAADSGSFIPGENIEIQAVSFSNTVFSNIGYSAKCITNSLFENVSSAKDSAYIANIRHLENLDKAVSGHNVTTLNKAEQTDSFSWSGFQDNIKKIELDTTGSVAAEARSVYSIDGSATGAGFYKPIEPDYELYYDGKNHSISDVATGNVSNAGLFGLVSTVKEVKDLELIDFNISGTATAGALAGTMSGMKVTNVLARNTDNSKAASCKITAPTAGGLIGDANGQLEYSAAAVVVDGSTTAGGFIGNASGGTINGCYSGGHTEDGTYEKWISGHGYDVTGGTAGGFVGTSAVAITNCYSTCSVSGDTAGGFAGSTGASINNCYATGRVEKKTSGSKFAFLGDGAASFLSDNFYYSAINEVIEADISGNEVTVLMPPIDSYDYATNKGQVKALDLNASEFNSFTGGFGDWNVAIAYDSALVKYYSGKYSLRSIKKLDAALPEGYFVSAHYGDWPSPEVFFIN